MTTAGAWSSSLVLCLSLLALSGCSTNTQDLPAASWRIDDKSPPSKGSLTIKVLVTRIECSGGVTGKVNEPTIDEAGDQVVVTYTVEDLGLGAATCQGNPEVPAVFQLSRPLDGRTLVDGICSRPESAATSYCQTSVRWEP